MDLLAKFRENWQAKGFAGTARPILLAVSGGADSMVMCHLFRAAGIPFGMAHCNFQLRGEDALLDEALVRQWAADAGVPFHYTRFDTAAESKSRSKGIQEVARDLRYEWLETIRAEHRYGYIATAHHADDNAETLLLNLFRGTGISGLHGIREINGPIIRPLLFADREALRGYAAASAVPFREDLSNQSDKYLRNAVRLHILPAIEDRFPQAAARIHETALRIAQAETLYQAELTRRIGKLCEPRGNDVYIPVRKLAKLEAAETIFYELFKPFGFSSAQSEQLMRLAAAESGRYLASATHKVIRDRNFLIVTPLRTQSADLIQIDTLPATVATANGTFHCTAIPRPDAFGTDRHMVCVDASKLKLPLLLRRWRTGDYFYPLGMGMKKKKLSRFFIDQKIPLHEKENSWVLESDKRIVWVCGMRLDERFKIGPATTSVLQLELRVQ